METIISLLLLIVTAILAVTGTLKGMRNGIKRQAIRTGTILIGILVSILLAKICANSIIGWLENQDAASLSSLLESFDLELDAETLGQIDATTLAYIIAIPVALFISPAIFCIFYLIMHFVTLIPSSILCGAFGFKKRGNSALSRLSGAALGLVTSLIVSAAFFVPVVGMLNMIDETFESVAESDSDAHEDILATYNETLAPISKSFAVDLLGFFGGDLIYDGATTVSVGDNSYNMSDEVAQPAVKIYLSLDSFEETDWFALTKDEQAALDSIIETIDESAYISDLFSDVLVLVADNFADGDAMADADPMLTEVMNTAIDVLKNMAGDEEIHLSDNLKTLTAAYYVLCDYKVLSDMDNSDKLLDNLLQVVEVKADGKKVTVMSKVTGILNSNKATVPIVTVLSKLSVAALANQLGDGADITAIYENVKEGVNEITKLDRTSETYVEEVSSILDESLTANGIELEEEVINDMAVYVDENYDEIILAGDDDGDGMISDQEMNNIMLSYYDVYVEYYVNEGGAN